MASVGDTWTFSNSSTGREGTIQTWTVPATGKYRLVAVGAQGGAGSRDGIGGLGALAAGDIYLEEGQVLEILVGQEGFGGSSQEIGGGGGTFIAEQGSSSVDDVYIVGGGGGGYGVGTGTNTTRQNNSHASTSTSGKGGMSNRSGAGSGGTNGSGGGSADSRGSGGGGFLGNGEDGSGNGGGGQAYVSGGLGGLGSSGPGGFGGGGATDQSTGWGATGGGGGFSGGGGAYSADNDDHASGGGGGSFVHAEAENVSITAEEGFGHGSAEIELVALGGTPPGTHYFVRFQDVLEIPIEEGSFLVSGVGAVSGSAESAAVPLEEATGSVSESGSLTASAEVPDTPDAPEATGKTSGEGSLSGLTSTPGVEPRPEFSGAISGTGSPSGTGTTDEVPVPTSQATVSGTGTASSQGEIPAASGAEEGSASLEGRGALSGQALLVPIAEVSVSGDLAGNGALSSWGETVDVLEPGGASFFVPLSALSEDAKNEMLDHLATEVTHVSLHSGDAFDGANEISGENFSNESYERKSPLWSAASSASVETLGHLVFDGPPGQEVASFGVWANGVFYGWGATVGPSTLNAEGRVRMSAGSKMTLIEPGGEQ